MLKKINNKTTKGLLALAILLGGGLATYSSVKADTVVATKANPFASVVTAIAQKFGLNETEVQAVVDEQMQKQRTEMQAKMQQNFATRLAQAVTNGKITQAQADLITAKHAEISAQMQALKINPTTESKEQIKALMDGVATWATTNNIPKEYLMFGFGGGRGDGHMGGGYQGKFGAGMGRGMGMSAQNTQVTQ